MQTPSVQFHGVLVTKIFLVIAAFTMLFLLIIPVPADALQRLSCPPGTTLKWTSGNYANITFNWRCIDDTTKAYTSDPTKTQVSSCVSGEREDTITDTLNAEKVCVPQSTPGSPSGKAPQSETSCTWGREYINPICWFRAGVTWGSAALISIAVTIMVSVGWLFNLVISQTIVGFNGWIGSADVLSTIEFGWTFFRDLANILIIGLFVFIAISIILGIKSYGQKSLIARVLIVAILINFSFLFTRIVINASNFLAVSFAQSLGASPPSTAQGWKPPDIAGKYTKLMGIGSWGETKDALSKIAEAQDSGWIALMHGLIVTILAICLALVLLYGAFLLIARAIIFIFLLVTSSLAFATYLLPNWASSDFGWKAWWTALFRNAMLAPIMMMFFVVTLKISEGLVDSLKANSGSGTTGGQGIGALGALATDPNNAQNVTALLLYIVILGLLYGSIRISNKFSGAAGQFAWTGTLPFANASVAWPSRSFGFISRNTVGRGAAKVSNKLAERAQLAPEKSWSEFFYTKASKAVKPIAGRDFNPGNLTNIKTAQTSLKGFTGQQERRAKSQYQDAKIATPTDEQIKQRRAEVRGEAEKQVKTEGSKIETEKKLFENLQKESADRQRTAEAERDKIEHELAAMRSDYASIPDGQKQAPDAVTLQTKIKQKEVELGSKSEAISRHSTEAQEHGAKAAELKEAGQMFQQTLEKRIQDRITDTLGDKFKVNVTEKKDAKGNIERDTEGRVLYDSKISSKDERVADLAVKQTLNSITNVLGKFIKTDTEKTNDLAKLVRKMSKTMAKEEHQKEEYGALVKLFTETQKTKEAAKETKEAVEKHGGGH